MMKYLDFPSSDDWRRIVKTSPLEKMRQHMKNLDDKNRSEVQDGIFGFMKLVEVMEFTMQLAHRLDDVIKSYVMLIYYYDKGIPDKEWYASPGKDGVSIQYYPKFEEIHFFVKEWFDFYSDTFYYKIFSAWDIVGHMLNLKYDLNIEEKDIGFRSSVNKLNNKDKNLYSKLEMVRRDPAFEKASQIRNDIAHNYLPSSAGLAVTLNEKGGTLGVRNYTTSAEIVENIQDTYLRKQNIRLSVESQHTIASAFCGKPRRKCSRNRVPERGNEMK
jgi:hypothetical protein